MKWPQQSHCPECRATGSLNGLWEMGPRLHAPERKTPHCGGVFCWLREFAICLFIEALGKDKVPVAAALLRRYLEYISAVLADNLRAKVDYRGDANYDLGDLMPPTLGRWKNRLGAGIKAAQNSRHDEEKTAIEAKLAEAEELIKKTIAEQWAIPVARSRCDHFTALARLTPNNLAVSRLERPP
jgi:hypothetical protein